MRKEDYKELQHLWDNSDCDWVLIRTNLGNSDEEPKYIIKNQRTGMVTLMGDNKLAEETISLMLAANVRVLPELK